jgi:hypothetical protein
MPARVFRDFCRPFHRLVSNFASRSASYVSKQILGDNRANSGMFLPPANGNLLRGGHVIEAWLRITRYSHSNKTDSADYTTAGLHGPMFMSAKRSPAGDFPQGITESHSDEKGWHRHANPASLIALGSLLTVAFMGVFGGQPHPARSIDTPSAQVSLELPERIRNGEFFEMRITVETKRDFDDLTLAISSTYWHDLTINTMIPAPADEKSEDGDYLFSYGEIEAGQKLTIKIDGQINPPLFGGTDGDIELRDGEATIARIPVEMKVMP